MEKENNQKKVLQVSGEWRAVVAKGDFSFFLSFDIESLGLRTVRLQQESFLVWEKRNFLKTNCLNSFPDSSILTSSFAQGSTTIFNMEVMNHVFQEAASRHKYHFFPQMQCCCYEMNQQRMSWSRHGIFLVAGIKGCKFL